MTLSIVKKILNIETFLKFIMKGVRYSNKIDCQTLLLLQQHHLLCLNKLARPKPVVIDPAWLARCVPHDTVCPRGQLLIHKSFYFPAKDIIKPQSYVSGLPYPVFNFRCWVKRIRVILG